MTSLRTLLPLALGLWTAVPAVALAQHTTTPTPTSELPKSLRKATERFESELGVRLHLHLDEPAPGAKGKIETGPVDEKLVRRALPRLAKHLSHYPATIRTSLLSDLHLVGKLRMRGKPFLGAAVPKDHRFDLAIRPRTTAKKLATTFHHEFAHLVEHDPRFPADDWVKISGKSAYKGKDHKAAYKGNSHLKAGFVTKYAARDRHEDMAELLELAFSNPDKAKKLAKQHKKIGTKLELLRSFYASLDPAMPIPGDDMVMTDKGKATKPGKKTRAAKKAKRAKQS